MDNNHIGGILAEPGAHRVGKLEHLLHTGHVVVVDQDPLDTLVEEGRVVGLLAAEVVDAVVVPVLGVQETRHLFYRVAIGGPQARAGKTGGNHPIGDVSQVQIETVLLVAPLILRDELAGRRL